MKAMDSAIYGVSSQLTGQAYDEALAIWDELERRYGLRAAQAAVHPHVTYVVGACDQPHTLVECLSAAAARLAPFDVMIEGVDTFDGPAPVVFLRVVPSEPLARAYQVICQVMKQGGLEIWPLYSENQWTPHVTLALRDLPPKQLPEVLRFLAHRRWSLTTRLETIHLVRVVLPTHEYVVSFPLAAGQ